MVGGKRVKVWDWLTPQNTLTNLGDQSHGPKPEVLPWSGEAGAALVLLDSSPSKRDPAATCWPVSSLQPCPPPSAASSAPPADQNPLCLVPSSPSASGLLILELGEGPLEGPCLSSEFVTSVQSDPGCWFQHCDQPTCCEFTFSHPPLSWQETRGHGQIPGAMAKSTVETDSQEI